MTPFLFYLVAGVILILVELLLFQMAVLWTLFIGLGALTAALVAWWQPEASWLLTTGVFVLASTVISFALYRPLKRWQDQPSSMKGSDALGQQVEVLEPISAEKQGLVKWSGTDWAAKLEPGSVPLNRGDSAEITALHGISLTVRKS